MIGASEYRRHAQDAFARGNIDLAIAYLENVLRHDPSDRESYYTIGRFLRMSGKAEPAARWYRACLERFPGDSIATVGLASLGAGPPPERLPDAVVLYVFDRNALTYDETMAVLDYAGPETLAHLLAREKGPPAGALDILDLGCGTGLCGPRLRPTSSPILATSRHSRLRSRRHSGRAACFCSTWKRAPISHATNSTHPAATPTAARWSSGHSARRRIRACGSRMRSCGRKPALRSRRCVAPRAAEL